MLRRSAAAWVALQRLESGNWLAPEHRPIQVGFLLAKVCRTSRTSRLGSLGFVLGRHQFKIVFSLLYS
jgi:hypothetical protein